MSTVANSVTGHAGGTQPVDYEGIVFRAREILDCGHVENVVRELQRLHTRYQDALARIATLEREAANLPRK